MSRRTSQAKLQLWKDRFEQFRQSGQTIQQFRRTLGCGRSSFHYSQRKLEPNRQSKAVQHQPCRVVGFLARRRARQ